MSLAYFDASALVKLVIEEPGSDLAAALWDGADAVVTSRVAHAEIRAALAAAHRGSRIDAGGLQVAADAWMTLRSGLRMIELTRAVEDHAGELTGRHALNGFDAIHLASALTLAEAAPIVATWDARLLRGAQAEGLRTLPATL